MIIFHDQKSLSLNFKSSRSQMFFKIDVLKNLAMFTGKHLCQSYFLIQLQGWRTAIVLQRDSNTSAFEIFKNTYFEEHLRTAASVLRIIKLLIKYWTSVDLFLIKNIKIFKLSGKIITWNGSEYIFLLIVSRKHSNRMKYCSDIKILTDLRRLVSTTCLF